MTRLSQYFLLSLLVGALGMPAVASAAIDEHQGNHKKMTGVVMQKAGALVVKTPDGATFQLNPKTAERHGHEPFKEGDEVSIVVDENNLVVDLHLKGEESAHRFVTGKLVEVGKTKKEIRLQTAEGEQTFPLEKLEIKAGPIPEGTQVTLELNETGSVIDLHRTDTDQHSH